MHVGTARGTVSGRGGGSGWARLYVNRTDPVELALAVDLQKSALAHVMNTAKTFAPVKAASAAIAFYQKINIFSHEPT